MRITIKEHKWEETLIEIPTELCLGNKTFVTTFNESATNGTSLTELRRRLEEHLDKKRIDLQCDYDDLV